MHAMLLQRRESERQMAMGKKGSEKKRKRERERGRASHELGDHGLFSNFSYLSVF
jgi:hypothetical protein